MNRDTAARAPETLPPQPDEPRLVLFGLHCRFTNEVIQALQQQRRAPVAIITPGPPGLREPIRLGVPRIVLPMVGGPMSVGVPAEIERFQIGSPGSPTTIDLIRRLRPDVIAVACYPRRLPHRLYSLATLGALNVHPSLLPRHRGPDPLFWTLREGDGIAGVTVHQLADELDSGPIVAQESMCYADGTTEAELEASLARIGGRMVSAAIRDLRDGNRPSISRLNDSGSYESWPTDGDYIIDTHRSARTAFNFIKGIAQRGIPIGVRIGGDVLWIDRAIDWAPRAPLDSPHTVIEFDDGVLIVELVHTVGRADAPSS